MNTAYLILASIILFVIYIKNYIRLVYLAFTLKGPAALPLLGNVLLIQNDKRLQEIGTNAYEMYGPIARCWVSIVPFIIIYEPKHLKIILGGKNSKKNIFYRILHNFIGKGLITNDGIKWKMHRKLIQPYFHNNVLRNYVPTFINNANKLLTKLEGKTCVKITNLINNCILSILHETVLGTPLTDEHEGSPFRKGEMILPQRVIKPWLLLESIFKCTPTAEHEQKQKETLYSYTQNVLSERRQKIRSLPKCLLDMFIEISENNTDFTDDDIINEAITFMLAGQDSVGAGIAFTLFYLAKHVEIQMKVMQEIDSIYERNSNLSITELNDMIYLEQCLKESLRLAPSVPIISRVLTEDVILDTYTLPAGTNVLITPFVTHRLPHYFPNPSKFDPDRFSKENIDDLNLYAFIAFSMGPRNCIGFKFAILEMKVIISTILRYYKISLAPRHENLTFSYKTTLKAKDGIWLCLKPRHKGMSI